MLWLKTKQPWQNVKKINSVGFMVLMMKMWINQTTIFCSSQFEVAEYYKP